MTLEVLLGNDTDWPNILVFAVFVGSGLTLLLLAFRRLGDGERQLAARLRDLNTESEGTGPIAIASLPEVSPLYREEKDAAKWQEFLKVRAIPLTFLLLALVLGLTLAFYKYPIITLAVIGAGVGIAGSYVAFHVYRRNVQRQRFVDQLPEAIDIIIRGARVGMSLPENFQVIAREMPDPVGRQFRILAEKLGIGIDLETALASAVNEIGVKELQFMATTLILQRRTGGQYAEVLENLSRVLRDRRAQYLKAKALTSESRVSARIVTIVTVVVLVILAATNKAQFDFLFDDPLGHNLLIYDGVSIFIGFFILSRLL
ncbi:unnamed protein product, partial [Discosporangium mesarthrocarpum]